MEILSAHILTIFLLLGSLAGFLAGLLGIGGGIILVPLFLWAFRMAGFHPEVLVHAAFATSLAIILPTTLSSTLGHRRRGNVDWHKVYYLAGGGIAGAVCGASAAAGLSGDWLKILFGLMQIIVAMKLLLFHPHLPPEEDRPSPKSVLLLVGFAGGAFSAFFGVGGGVVAVPMMILMLRLPVHQAVGNSSALIVLSSLSGALAYMFHGWGMPHLAPYSLGYVNILVALIVAPFTILFARLGVRVAGRLSHARLLRVFALLLMVVGLRMVSRIFF